MNFKVKSATTSQNVVLEEPLLFERSRAGAKAVGVPKLDVPLVDPSAYFGDQFRTQDPGLPELSEPEVIRHFTRLSTWNYAIDLGIYPLGSCTMKYNPRLNEEIARSAEVGNLHPLDPVEWSQGHLQIMYELQEDLKEVTGLPAVSLQPAAGAHGELAGLMMVAAYHRAKGNAKKVILTADTAHGTNPASAALAGFEIIQMETGKDGVLHPEAVAKMLNGNVAALMLTNPNTLGVFERYLPEISRMLHEVDALLYIDGANMNAVMGIAKPGSYDTDVIQFNLHKTFSTPHGGGGPGSGPIAVSKRLEPFLPSPLVEKQGNTFVLQTQNSKSIGRIKSFYGNFGMFIRAWTYIKALGGPGLYEVSKNAILNANYIRARLKEHFHLPVEAPTLHEVVFNDKWQRENNGLDTSKMAKKLIDYGMHPPTVHFPLCVKNAIMIEPTETESLDELDRFVNALLEVIMESDVNLPAPVCTPRQKVDEVKAARELSLNYFNLRKG